MSSLISASAGFSAVGVVISFGGCVVEVVGGNVVGVTPSLTTVFVDGVLGPSAAPSSLPSTAAPTA